MAQLVTPFLRFAVMAASTELSFQVQEREARRRAIAKAKDGLSSARYLTPSFLNYFPVVMESKEDDIMWNEVSGLFRRRDTIPPPPSSIRFY